jgi:predicted HTH domain antitoxin
LLKDSALAGQEDSDRVRVALAVHLFQEGRISIGKAAELAEVSRVDFELLLVQMGFPVVRYDVSDLEQDLRALGPAD